MLFNNPKQLYTDITGGISDGTYVHEDAVFQKIVKNLTPPTIYNENKELIDTFSQTVANYSPISINITDYWNKSQLRNVVVPLNDSDFDTIDEDKIYDDGIRKAFFVNSIKNLQEKLAEMYLNNFYVTAYKVKNSHTLRQKLYQIFDQFNIPTENKNLLFNNINELFTEERFITNKDYSSNKGKITSIRYAAQSAHDAEIEGPLKNNTFYLEHEEVEPLSYKVDSVILPDVYNAFVKPLSHPLGFGLEYNKVCKTDLTDRVFNTIKWTSDKVSVKCTYESNVSPFDQPARLLPWILNPEWSQYVEDQQVIDPEYNPDENSQPMDKWVPDLPFESAIQNNESIMSDESIAGPWDPLSKTPEIVFATNDGYNLWTDLGIDEGQGNILKDIEYGYGSDEYINMKYTKYIFENNNYLIEYSCITTSNTIKRIIEYYRYDEFDSSIYYNVIADDTRTPEMYYPNIKTTNLTHGRLNDVGALGNNPVKSTGNFAFDTGDGLDSGSFDGSPAVPDTLPPRAALNDSLQDGTPISFTISREPINKLNFISTEQNIFNTNMDLTDAHVFLDGIKVRSNKYTILNRSIILDETLPAGSLVDVVVYNDATATDFDATTGQTELIDVLSGNSRIVSVFVNGIKTTDQDYIISEDGTDITFNVPLREDMWIQVMEFSEYHTETYKYSEAGQYIIPFPGDPRWHEIYINGLRLQESRYTVLNDNLFTLPGDYTWDTETNIINKREQVTKIYSLIARFIEKRECIINTENLQETEEISIKEEFDVSIIPA